MTFSEQIAEQRHTPYADWRITPQHIGCAYRSSFDVRTELTERDVILAECDLRLRLRENGWQRFRFVRRPGGGWFGDTYTITRVL